jgi:hypothetical protein
VGGYLAIVVVVAMAGVSAGARPLQENTAVSLSRAETEALVKKDLAQRLKVEANQLQLISASDRTWMDASFGCSARKGLDEPTPIQGFAFTLAYRGKDYVYHTDRKGHFRRCDAGKPIAPISR